MAGVIHSCSAFFSGKLPNVPSGYTLDWNSWTHVTNPANITFDKADLQMTFAGSTLNDSTKYVLFVYLSDSQFNWTLSNTISLGHPSNQTLSTKSLFENGYTLDTYGTYFQLAH